MIRGIGPAYAKKLVWALGERVFYTIEVEPDRPSHQADDQSDGDGSRDNPSASRCWRQERRLQAQRDQLPRLRPTRVVVGEASVVDVLLV